MNKVRTFISTVHAIARAEDIHLLLVAPKLLIAKFKFGLRMDYFGLYRLAIKPVSSYRYYMHKKELELLQKKVNDLEGRKIVDSKLLFFNYCKSHGLPTPEIYACLSSTKGSDSIHGVPVIRDSQHLIDIINNSCVEEFIFKPQKGSHGLGLIRFKISDKKIISNQQLPIDPQLFLDELRSKAEIYLLQPALRPSSDLQAIMPGKGLGTIRIVTTNCDGIVNIEMASLKLPFGNNAVDNFYGGRTGNSLAHIDLESGVIGPIFSISKENEYVLLESNIHPQTGLILDDFRFPHWDEMIALTRKAALKFNSLYTIGWDIALTDQGPCLIEGNWRYDIDLLQITARRGLRQDILKVLSCEVS